MAIKLDYVARETFHNLRRNFLMTSAAVLTVAVSLSLVGGALLLKRGRRQGHPAVAGRRRVLDLHEARRVADRERRGRARAEGHARGRRASTTCRSRTRYDEFKRDVRELARLRRRASPSSRCRRRTGSCPQRGRAGRARSASGSRTGPACEEVVYAKDQIKALLKVTRILQLMLWAVALVLLLAASLLILNTIRMAIFARRREIEVMKLVGATNWFIRIPFMLEGLVQGVAGAAAAFGVVWVVRNFAQNAVRNVELFRQFAVSTTDVASTGIFLVFVGAMVGAVGSAFAVTRFLDV